MIIENLESEPHLFLYLCSDQRIRLNIDQTIYFIAQLLTSVRSGISAIKLRQTYQNLSNCFINIKLF